MSSLSLPRVLQNKKTSLDIQRENFEKAQANAISKAINVNEIPVKEKHVRSTIIGTFQEKGGHTFWLVVLKLPLQDNRIVAWKFCHVLHKVLREGHPNVIPHSQGHRGMILDLGKLWCHLKEGYGDLIRHYTQLLVTKLDFHRRNPRFPGNLSVTNEELERIGENDINTYFEMAVEMFDYLDAILALQTAIFGSLDMSRCNSMMSSGQCRLAPLIPCIQDSSRLYDYCVQILFKLHSSLPPDTLIGHRDRFLQQFKSLREFYESANTLQYFKNLIQVPLLPDRPPNFLIEADLRSYVAPMVVVPQEEPEPEPTSVEGCLIDTTDSAENNGTSESSVSYSIIAQMEEEICRLRAKIDLMRNEHQRIVEELSDRKMELETELATKDSELIQERQLKEDLLKHTEESSKYQEYEKLARTKDEKFQKLKDVYGKLREEHIQLLRSKAEVEKQLTVARSERDEAAKLKEQVNELLSERSKSEEVAVKMMTVESQLCAVKAEKDNVEADHQALAAKVDWLVKEKTDIESELQDLLAQKESLDVRLKELLADHNELLRKNRNSLLNITASEAKAMIKAALDEMDNPALSACHSSPDYLRSLVDPLLAALTRVSSAHAKSSQDGNPDVDSLVVSCLVFSSIVGNFLLHCRTAGNSSPDIDVGERLAECGKEVGAACLELTNYVNNLEGESGLTIPGENVRNKVDSVIGALEKLTGALKGDSSELIADLVENELTDMEKAIEEAAKRIEEIAKESRQSHSGVKLEVNEKILDSCTSLMAAIRILVQKARILQAEVVAQGKGTASAKDFYKRNHRWTEGLISAAKAVASGATFLLSCADKVVRGEAKFEPLIVASQEIAASTAQLVVASRVKADRNSSNLSELGAASRGVTQATAGVVATAKSCAQLVEETEELDVSKLTLHQAKRQEMESQVRVLELEASLQQERVRLSALRRHHYQLAGDSEGWEIKDE